MRIDTSHFRVLVVSPLASVAGRMKLNGVHRFLSEGHDWEITLIRNESDFTSETFRAAARDGYHGLFVGWREAPDMQALHAELTIPSVLFDRAAESVLTRNRRAVLVHDDAKSIARAAAQHFIAQGRAASFGFVPTREPTFWSAEREAAFVAEMRRRGATVTVYRADDTPLADWLAARDRPCGVFCASDDVAMTVLQTGRRLGLNVPDDLAVLGVNNDEQICENTRPKLSSVAVDFEELGYRAARELHAMMLRGQLPRENVIQVGSAQVFARASTSGESPAGALVSRALAYIAANAMTDLRPLDVVRHVRVSRRLLDLRFREVTGTTVHETIRKHRLAAVCRLLKKTKKSILEIALACGYPDANYLKNQFRRAFGVSMRTYRRACSERAAS